jgi:hypothetical protein
LSYADVEFEHTTHKTFIYPLIALSARKPGFTGSFYGSSMHSAQQIISTGCYSLSGGCV